MLLKPFQLHTPVSLDEACDLWGSLQDTKILAGGSFLINSLKLLKRKGSRTPQNVISLRKIPELRGLEPTADGLTIRAMTTITDLFHAPELTDNFAVLRTVCRNISTNPVRNMATFGGNLTCRYTWTELGAVMIALDARMFFRKAGGEEDEINAEDFFKNSARSDGIFTHAVIPRDPEARVAYRRVRKTMHVDVPLLAVCVKARCTDGTLFAVRTGINNGTGFAQRDRTLENFLEGHKTTPQTSEAAMAHLTTEIYDKRSDEYKQHMFRVSLRGAIRELMEQQAVSGK